MIFLQKDEIQVGAKIYCIDDMCNDNPVIVGHGIYKSIMYTKNKVYTIVNPLYGERWDMTCDRNGIHSWDADCLTSGLCFDDDVPKFVLASKVTPEKLVMWELSKDPSVFHE